jgi:predicted phosphodiesterase
VATVDVFAVEDRAVQLAWSSLPSPGMLIEVGGQRVEVGSLPPVWSRGAVGRGAGSARSDAAQAAGPGAVTVTGLEPATTYDVCLSGPGQSRVKVATATTLPSPPGRLLARFATISDCHIGESWVGPLHRFHDPRPRPPGLAAYPVRCARAAMAEAEAWGTELLVAKGDLTQSGEATEIYQAVDLLREASVPVEVILGNHDVKSSIDAVAAIAGCGLAVTRQPRARDLPGVRLVLGHSPLPDRHGGAVSASDAAGLARLAREGHTPAVAILHHPPRRIPVQTYYPPSIRWRDSTRLVAALAAAQPATLLLAGHTHRNRRYQVGGLTVAEVGSTKDYPGQWAGYAVHEGGIRQVVFRVADETAMAWTEPTRRAVGGVWGWWSPGRLADRCWTLEWPNRVIPAG